MKKYQFLLIALLLGGFAHAQVTVSGGVDFASKYLWRGYNLVNGPVLQPSADISFGESGFAVNIWASAALQDRGINGAADEFDVTLAYGKEVNDAYSVSAGLIYYSFPNQDSFSFSDHTTPELFASLGLSKVPFSPSVSFYYDLNLGDGWFAGFSAEQSFKIAEQPLNFGANLGYNQNQFGADAGFKALALSLGSDFKVGDFSVSPALNAAFAPEKSMTDVNHWFFTLSVSR